MVTSLLLQLENPVQLVSQLFPAELVSRDAIDSALCNWLGAARSSVMDEGSNSSMEFSPSQPVANLWCALYDWNIKKMKTL